MAKTKLGARDKVGEPQIKGGNEPPALDTVSANLRIAMANAEISIRDLAAYAGVHERTLKTHLENSETLKMKTIQRYAKVLGVSIGELCDEEPLRDRIHFTGSAPLDRILRWMINAETDESSRKAIGPYISPDYLCTSSMYAGHEVHSQQIAMAFAEGYDSLMGYPWEVESQLQADQEAAGTRGVTQNVVMASIIAPDAVLVVRDNTVERHYPGKSEAFKGATQPREIGGPGSKKAEVKFEEVDTSYNRRAIILWFEHPIADSIADSDASPWVIVRKHWENIEAGEQVNTKVLTSFAVLG